MKYYVFVSVIVVQQMEFTPKLLSEGAFFYMLYTNQINKYTVQPIKKEVSLFAE